MKQREVQDAEGTRWVCVQAFAGVDGAAADAATARVERDAGAVPVVCTPSGGAATVRLALEAGWEETASDDALCAALARARRG